MRRTGTTLAILAIISSAVAYQPSSASRRDVLSKTLSSLAAPVLVANWIAPEQAVASGGATAGKYT